MNKWFLLFFQIVIIYSVTTAQIAIKSIPVSYNNPVSSSIPVIEIPNIPPKFTQSTDKVPTQAGYTLPLNFRVSDMGRWEETGNSFVWQLEIYISGAKAINLYFDKMNLLNGEKLYIYDPKNEITLGAFTNYNNGPTMCTDFIKGDKLIIEFNSNKQYRSLPFSIHEAGILLSDQMMSIRGFGDAGFCEVHVNCVEGENWQKEKNGVARILVKESELTFWCTGSLINNTNNDGTPYFLTANHCGENADSIDYSQWLFYFNFESLYCGEPVNEPESKTISGSSLIANSQFGTNNGSDFKLLLLNDTVPSDYRPYFNGWDVTGNASPSGVTIHHPQGDLKMISTYTTPIVSTRYYNPNEDPSGKYWKVYWAKTVTEQGVTEGGSSGSPLFSNEGYIVGSLTGGEASCVNKNGADYYGKLSNSWGMPSRQDSTFRLSYWLDPNETGVTKLKGVDLDSSNIVANFIGEPTTIVVGELVTFSNTSHGNINGYSWEFEGGSPEYSEQFEPDNIYYTDAGKYDVRLIVTSAEGSDTLIRKDYIKVIPNLSPNPSDGMVKLTFGDSIPEDISIRIFNSIGQETKYQKIQETNNCVIIEILPKTRGLYFINVSGTDLNNTYKVIVDGTQVPIACN